ncbi:DUF6221 family protein [Streptomyces sp. AK02-04a]|uniref:DUF6221 family protein n=1 Tax=Streptomyces sp. AK02-04a TaxID=3028649 RepID=UPI0029A1F438|nr:DUF6221 family protein [Streptomyces sp. AK02-04a]MDX3764030.1 DUF6221 family protein [Streptomyces sp. AK02-04a]
MDELVRFVSARLSDGIDTAHTCGQMLVAHGDATLGVSSEAAERHARFQVHAAETKRTLFQETIRPYLDVPGPAGLVAEQQLRIFASLYADHPDYRNEWRP